MKMKNTIGGLIAERNRRWDMAGSFLRDAQCFERGSSDWKRFQNEAAMQCRLADKAERAARKLGLM